MINNEYVLSEKRDGWFLQQNRTEGFTGETFRAGDHIVVCGKCKSVWFPDSWEVKNRCPGSNCRNQETRPFEKSIFELRETNRIHIRKPVKEGKFVPENRRRRTRKARKQKEKTAFNSFFDICARIFPKLRAGLVTAAAALTIFQFVCYVSPLTGKPGSYYRGTVAEKLQKAGGSAADSVSDIRDSLGNTAVKTGRSMTDTARDTNELGVRIVHSAGDSIDKILHHSMEFFIEIAGRNGGIQMEGT